MYAEFFQCAVVEPVEKYTTTFNPPKFNQGFVVSVIENLEVKETTCHA
jgi:hypothetical protein